MSYSLLKSPITRLLHPYSRNFCTNLTSIPRNNQQSVFDQKNKSFAKKGKESPLLLSTTNKANHQNTKNTIKSFFNGNSPLNQTLIANKKLENPYHNRKFQTLLEISNNTSLATTNKSASIIHESEEDIAYDEYIDYNQRNRNISNVSIKYDHKSINDYKNKLQMRKMKYSSVKTMHENWNFYLSEGQHKNTSCFLSEPEIWNVIQYINKRHSYGKSLRYSDRFYMNYAIKQAKVEDKRSNETYHKQKEKDNAKNTFR